MHKLNKLITINYITFLLGCIKIKRHSIKMSNHNLDIFYSDARWPGKCE